MLKVFCLIMYSVFYKYGMVGYGRLMVFLVGYLITKVNIDNL